MRVNGISVSGEQTGKPTETRHVEPRRTPVSVSELRGALDRAHRSLTGHAMPPAMLDVMTAQASHETGRGQSMYNYNFGGIKGTGPSGMTASCMTSEVYSTGAVRLKQNFRAYESLDEGARDYVAFMHTRYAGALDKAAVGDLDGFAHALKQSGYYTAAESDYATALRAHAGTLLKESPHKAVVASTVSAPIAAPTANDFSTAAEVARIVDVVARASARIVSTEEDV